MRRLSLWVLMLAGCTDKGQAGPADADGDGFAEDVDCDDGDETVYPDAPELCDDGKPNACGITEADAFTACAWTGELDLRGAPLKVNGAGQDDQVGVAATGDINGDGLLDLVVGAPGQEQGGALAGTVYMMLSGASWTPAAGTASVSTAELAISGKTTRDQAGSALVVSDLDGDGQADIAIGAPGEESELGAVHLFFSSGVLGLDDDDRWTYEGDLNLPGTSAGGVAGTSLAAVADVDGDGLADLAVGAPVAGADQEGEVYLCYSSGSLSAESASLGDDLTMSGLAHRDRAGLSVAGLADVDGDGQGELVVGAPKATSAGVEGGAVYVLLSSGALGSGGLADADLAFSGVGEGDQAGNDLADAGDIDGDGRSDLLIGEPGASPGGDGSGQARLLLGGGALKGGGGSLVGADLTLLGVSASDRAGISVSGAGDVDGDGGGDIAVGGNGYSIQAEDGGATWLALSSGALSGASGSLNLSAVDAVFYGHDSSDEVGAQISAGGDVDGDGYDDLMIGAQGDDDGGSYAGAVYLMLRRGF